VYFCIFTPMINLRVCLHSTCPMLIFWLTFDTEEGRYLRNVYELLPSRCHPRMCQESVALLGRVLVVTLKTHSPTSTGTSSRAVTSTETLVTGSRGSERAPRPANTGLPCRAVQVNRAGRMPALIVRLPIACWQHVRAHGEMGRASSTHERFGRKVRGKETIRRIQM
jgi:hypothetical protein